MTGPRLQIAQAGTDIIHRPAREIEPRELASADIQRLIDIMFVTLSGNGVGLAAPQVGVGLQLVVIEDPAAAQAQLAPQLLALQERVPIEPHVLVNPMLAPEEDETAEFFEGCLSVEGYRAIVPRARRVRLQALDRHGVPFERSASGWYARILQHEVDHLRGQLYVEKMLPRTFVAAESYLQRWMKMSIAEAKAALSADTA